MEDDTFENLIKILSDFRDENNLSSTEVFEMMVSFVSGAAVSGGLEKDEALEFMTKTLEFFYGVPGDVR